jgi:hypothetical protein
VLEFTLLHSVTDALIKIFPHLLQTLFLYFFFEDILASLCYLKPVIGHNHIVEASLAATYCYFILEVSFQIHGRDTDCTAVPRVFTQFIQANIWILSFLIRPRLLPSALFPILDTLFPHYCSNSIIIWTTDWNRNLQNAKHFRCIPKSDY